MYLLLINKNCSPLVLLEYSDREATKVYTNRLRKSKLFSDDLWGELDYETSSIAE